MGGAMTANAFKLDKYVSRPTGGSLIGIATVVLFNFAGRRYRAASQRQGALGATAAWLPLARSAYCQPL
jgi:hypothetical protein